MKNTTTVTVIIPTFRRLDILKKCLEGVYSMNYVPSEVLVIYRPKDDPETGQWLENIGCKKYSPFVPLPVYKPGQVTAMNTGLEKATSDIIAIFDDDAIPIADWLDRIMTHFDTPRVGAVGGRDRIAGHPQVKETTKAGYRDWWGNITGNHHIVVGDPRNVEIAKGCNWAIRRAAIGSLRFDDRLLGYGAQVANDSWFCLNLRQANWEIILDPNALVDHFPASKPDYSRTQFSHKRCYETTCNITASKLAFTPWHLRLRFLIYQVFVGQRDCPGTYFILHSLLKRPKSLPGQLIGGWKGFFKGWSMANEFEKNPPGTPTPPPLISPSLNH